ncbi:MAG: 50S ribosomal protein L27 [Candidatus Wolfebacteria bacterium GW2011_GWC1_43_10]|uniref:Large ribosomal subunit protein bL27 n=1 Tax=Candidatus Wolfebacteria bacterium GW2011_GWC1_43_10 TaxID=1619011 RepID=A0A0G1CA41_9BACT|nr:MAG: 50S ribosomal protein L27 [Candidatus Wolfebacteria bacterium GW2011_GWC1_43_10]KKT22595.1 MAG: 50S ribosomal protein L27 [Parcubacteria group bacterium GW2011_GWB1_43_8b]KKT85825.1 MAG: 50S ribosomal protein L27 [Parcubacteria group bacterium GW2011_GWA1_Parcubacteria_45_10]
MAHTKQLGSTKLGRESESKRLGVKRQHGQPVRGGEILIRQRGSRYLAGRNVKTGADDTLYAARNGVVQFRSVKKIKFDGNIRYATQISVK